VKPLRIPSYDRLTPLPSPGIGRDASSFARTTVYPPLPSGPAHHPVGQTCPASGDRICDRSKDKLLSSPLKVASWNLALPLKVASWNQASPLKVAL
jgi:hypothetical protein